MALKEEIISIREDGRELTFRIRQMPAASLESWLMRAAILIGKSGAAANGKEGHNLAATMSSLSKGRGLDALLCLLGGLDYEQAKALLDEMLGCCWRVREDGTEEQVRLSTLNGYIEDITTLVKLRGKALEVNLGFFKDAAPSLFQEWSGKAESKPSS